MGGNRPCYEDPRRRGTSKALRSEIRSRRFAIDGKLAGCCFGRGHSFTCLADLPFMYEGINDIIDRSMEWGRENNLREQPSSGIRDLTD